MSRQPEIRTADGRRLRDLSNEDLAAFRQEAGEAGDHAGYRALGRALARRGL